MLVVHDAFNSTDLPRGGVATIGNFDGLHRGQRGVIERVQERAEALGTSSLVITFEPHPVAVLRPESTPPRLTTPEQKEKLLEEAGVDVTLVVRFTPEFARTTARDFVSGFLCQRLGLAEVHVGASFVFGHQREGDLTLLEEVGGDCGFAAHAVEPLRWSGERISSTRIRKALAEGRVDDAEEMLGRAYSVAGTVARGDRMGQKIGWPTINVAPGSEEQLIPLSGVYATRVHLPSYPATFDSVTNIGTRPTVYENYRRVVESHVLDFNADVYGERVAVSFYRRLREEKIFPTVMDLSAQIGRDVEATREYFATRRRLEEQILQP
ncbi:MAG TPA: bifunctional riboflavin kinase/FAD synthetase [Thermoanaerobaculia bacterium]|nr:bifunctional riboflavin kinase/FAD synthetase [Thermoanaerobaculia bacterium]